MQLIKRQEAKRLGMTRYFTGEPCARGHVAERRVRQGDCAECNRIYSDIYNKKRAKSLKKPPVAARKFFNEHLDPKQCNHCGCIKRASDFYNYSVSVAAIQRCKECDRARTNRRRPRLKLATPSWLTKEDKQQMERIWREASKLGMSVDHVVPIKGRTVCGLNVPWNLQIVPLDTNQHKRNRF